MANMGGRVVSGLTLPKSRREYVVAGVYLLIVALLTAWIGSVIWNARPAKADAINTTDFVTTWNVRNLSGHTEIEIETEGTGYNYSVDWDNDGIPDETGITGDAAHEYGAPGVYTIRISGDFPRMYLFDNGFRNDELIDIKQWGGYPMEELWKGFLWCGKSLNQCNGRPGP